MSNGKLGKSAVLGVVALLSASLAACDPKANAKHEPSARADARQTVARLSMRPNVLRVQLDAPRDRVWALGADAIEVHAATASRSPASIRLPGWISATEPDACAPDFAVLRSGDVLVTSNMTPTIWRIDSATLEVTRHELAVAGNADRDVGFSRLFYSAHHDALFAVSAIDSSLWSIDRSLTRAQPIALAPPLPQTCVRSLLPDSADNALCVQTEQGDRIVILSADLRSGETRSAKCSNERPRPRSRDRAVGVQVSG